MDKAAAAPGESGSIRFQFIGGAVWLDFINTKMADRGRPVEALPDTESLLSWLAMSGLIDGDTREGAVRGPEHLLLGRALSLRDALHRIAIAIIEQRVVDGAAVAEMNDVLAAQSRYSSLGMLEDGTLERREVAITHGIAGLLAPIAESACDWLVNGDHALLRKCANPDCVLVFLDTTRNHRRRWCSMAACGNRDKAATFYRRARSSASV